MSPIPLGIWATAGAGGAAAGSYELIETITVSGSTTSVSFTNGSWSGYKHLQIRASIRGSYASTGDRPYIKFNGLAGQNYAEHWLYGSGASTSFTGNGNQDKIQQGQIVGNSGYANVYSSMIIDILDHGNTQKNKTIKTFMGGNWNSSEVGIYSGVVKTTSALTDISIYTNNGGIIDASRFSLYGLKG